MTQIAIQQQIEAIRKTTEEALKTKESALKFLKDAGIISDKAAQASKSSDKKKK